MGETRKYRKFTVQQKIELVLASLRGPKTMTQLCREHEISEPATQMARSVPGRRC